MSTKIVIPKSSGHPEKYGALAVPSSMAMCDVPYFGLQSIRTDLKLPKFISSYGGERRASISDSTVLTQWHCGEKKRKATVLLYTISLRCRVAEIGLDWIGLDG